MISPQPFSTFTPSRTVSGKLRTEYKLESPPLSPKRSFAQLEEDQPPQLECRRRDVQPSKRVPLDPLSASDLENRRGRPLQPTDSALYHALVTPPSVTDLRALHPEQPASVGSCGMRRSSISNALVCSWPPPIPTPGTARSSYNSVAGQQASQYDHSFHEISSRATFLETTSIAWDAPDSLPTDIIAATMIKPTRTTGWKSENVLQPIRSRASSMPSVRRPPGELWRSDPGPIVSDHELVDSFVYSTPPGLPPRRAELRRSDSNPDPRLHGLVSLSLAPGSQPLRASDHTKAVPPIGAERSRVVSITSYIRNSPATKSHDPSWCSPPLSPRLQATRNNEIRASNTTSCEKTQATAGSAHMSREDLERLLRHAVRNKYAPKVVSPLSPLRTPNPALNLSADPAYQLRMPSQSNVPSPRYSKFIPRRARTVCDMYRSLDWDAPSMHCQECKRDTVGKRLLALRYCQQQTHHLQRTKPLAYPLRAPTSPVLNDDRMVLANCIREAFTYEMDEEEKSLWEEVAAVTGVGPASFSRVGAPCGVAAVHRRAADDVGDRCDDRAHDDHPEFFDDGLLVNESATLFRQVSVY